MKPATHMKGEHCFVNLTCSDNGTGLHQLLKYMAY